MNRAYRSLLACGLFLAAACSTVPAETAKVGEKAPDWSDIVGIDDEQHALGDYQDAKLIVLVFTCNHCPVAKGYEDRLVALQKDYQDKGVRLIAVNVNNLEEDRLEPMKKRAEEKGFNFPYLYDSTQQIGLDYGATKTPEVFLLDKDRKIIYHGAIDDNLDTGKVTVHYLRDALDAALKGEDPSQAETAAFGCGIKYEKK